MVDVHYCHGCSYISLFTDVIETLAYRPIRGTFMEQDKSKHVVTTWQWPGQVVNLRRKWQSSWNTTYGQIFGHLPALCIKA